MLTDERGNARDNLPVACGEFGGVWGPAVNEVRTKLAGVDRETGTELWAKDIPSFRGMNILTPVPVGEAGVFTSTYGGNTRLLRLKDDGKKYAVEDAWALLSEKRLAAINGVTVRA